MSEPSDLRPEDLAASEATLALLEVRTREFEGLDPEGAQWGAALDELEALLHELIDDGLFMPAQLEALWSALDAIAAMRRRREEALTDEVRAALFATLAGLHAEAGQALAGRRRALAVPAPEVAPAPAQESVDLAAVPLEWLAVGALVALDIEEHPERLADWGERLRLRDTASLAALAAACRQARRDGNDPFARHLEGGRWSALVERMAQADDAAPIVATLGPAGDDPLRLPMLDLPADAEPPVAEREMPLALEDVFALLDGPSAAPEPQHEHTRPGGADF